MHSVLFYHILKNPETRHIFAKRTLTRMRLIRLSSLWIKEHMLPHSMLALVFPKEAAIVTEFTCISQKDAICGNMFQECA